MSIDCVLIHPSAQHGIYGPLASNLTAVEPPTWCRMIAGWLRDRGYSVAIIDQEAERRNAYDVVCRIEDLNPRLTVIVVSGHQPSASTQQMTAAIAISNEMRTEYRTLIVGNHPSALPEETLRDVPRNWVCDGEGPLTILGLLLNLQKEEILGLVWFDKGANVIRNPPAPLIPIDYLHGDVWDLLPMDKYRAHQWQCFGDLSKRKPYASIYTTLGCPHHCEFCMINVFQHSNAYRRRTPSKVVAEIVKLYREYGVKTFKFADEMFVLHRQHVTDICQGLIDSGISDDINIWAYSRIDSIFPDLLSLMRRAGIRWLALGIESGNSEVRDGSEKHMNDMDIYDAVKEIRDADINVIGNFIFGLPQDTLWAMKDTLDLAKSLELDFANFYCAMPYPGSKLYDDTLRDHPERLPKTWRAYSQHNNECYPLANDNLTAAEILKFRDDAFIEYFTDPNYLQMIEVKFGFETRQHIEKMTELRLERDIVKR